LLVNRKLKGGKMTSAEKRGHVIICNWNEKGEHVIKELRSKDLPEIRPVLIIAKSTELSEYFKEPPKKVYWEDKDPTDFEVLKQERIDQAHSVIVLIDNSLKEHPDNKSAVIIRLIKNLCESSKKKSGPNICVEVADEKNKDTLKRFGAHEFVSASYSVERLLAQSAISPGITKFFDNLLTVTPNSNEVCMIKCPKNFESHSFEEVAHALAQLRDTDNPVILCGVKTNNQLIINPQKDKFDKFKPGDELLVIVWTATKLSQINKIKL
jgi:voltage-gated potassium channel